MIDTLNPIAIAVGTVGYMILGFVWYAGFSTIWTDAMGWSEEEMAEGGTSVGYLITTIILDSIDDMIEDTVSGVYLL